MWFDVEASNKLYQQFQLKALEMFAYMTIVRLHFLTRGIVTFLNALW